MPVFACSLEACQPGMHNADLVFLWTPDLHLDVETTLQTAEP